MPFRLLPFLLLFLVSLHGQVTQIAGDAPIVNFRLPTFTPEGYRDWMIRGSEARLPNKNEVNIRDLNLTIFSKEPNNKIETVILSPSAQVVPDAQVATGSESIRVINDAFEASGSDWRYAHKEQRITIRKDVHVSFRAQLKPLLQ